MNTQPENLSERLGLPNVPPRMQMLTRIYVAGPYTSAPQGNTKRAIQVGNLFARMGLLPFIPHLTHFWEEECPRPYEYWLAYDLEWLYHCDSLFRLTGDSSGADKEEKKAHEQSIPIFYDYENLVTYILDIARILVIPSEHQQYADFLMSEEMVEEAKRLGITRAAVNK